MRAIRILVAALLVAMLLSAQGQQKKKRVAVLNFDYATVQSGVAALFGANQDIGKGIADLLVDRLVGAGTYSVIERKPWTRSWRNRTSPTATGPTPTRAAKIARVLGVDAIIIGSITQFGRDDKKTNIGGGALGGVPGGSDSAACRDQVDRRGGDHRPHDQHRDRRDPGQRYGPRRIQPHRDRPARRRRQHAEMAQGALDMRSKNFADTVLGEATSKAVTDIAGQLNAKSAALPARVVTIEALVADAAPDGTVIINVGSRGGSRSATGSAWSARCGTCVTPPRQGASHVEDKPGRTGDHRSGRAVGGGQVHRRGSAQSRRHGE